MAMAPATRETLEAFALTVRTGRRARRWTQRRLAKVVGIAQSHVARIESAEVPSLSFDLANRVLDAIGARMTVNFMGVGPAPVQRDRAHARCVGFVARRLERAGYRVATEVPMEAGRWHGFADVLAFHPTERVLLVIEVKTELHDFGDIDRQLGIAERGAWQAARQLGWRPRAIIGALLVLATDENDRRLTASRALLDRMYSIRARLIQAIVDGDRAALGQALAVRGHRAFATVDPASRRRAWLIPGAIDGRRTAARYANRAAFLAR